MHKFVGYIHKKKKLTNILGVIDGYTEILKRAWVRSRGQGGSQSQEDRSYKKVNSFHGDYKLGCAYLKLF